ncbi:MAG: phosphotransferase, partial [Bacteroidaceae bacterium]|nr:phosphotransferase [Bacteroidaceae bacterium]
MEQERLTNLYTRHFGTAPTSIQQLPGAGSNRRYYRISSSDGSRYIGCIGTSAEENRSFIALARHLYSKGLSVPQVLCATDDCNV